MELNARGVIDVLFDVLPPLRNRESLTIIQYPYWHVAYIIILCVQYRYAIRYDPNTVVGTVFHLIIIIIFKTIFIYAHARVFDNIIVKYKHTEILCFRGIQLSKAFQSGYFYKIIILYCIHVTLYNVILPIILYTGWDLSN